MPMDHPPFSTPSLPSTLGFLAIVAFVCAGFLWGLSRAQRVQPASKVVSSQPRSLPLRGALVLGPWMALTALLARAGVFARLAESGHLLVYVVAANGLALGFAFSDLGGRVARAVPLAALLGFQGFRLPLELVLHSWYAQGSVPVQMTYSGDNFDIVTGVVSLGAAALLAFAPLRARTSRIVAGTVNLVGFALLLRVMSIALRSTPGPLRTYLDTEPLLLPLHAPYTWILPVCVAGALLGHVLTFRRLLREGPNAARPSRRARPQRLASTKADESS